MNDAMFTSEKTVLIVDDSPVCLRHAAGILKEKYRVACAKSGKMALSYLAAQKVPDLILLDLNMPEMDGMAVYRRIKYEEKTKEVPVFFLTGVEDAMQQEKYEELPKDKVLHKPVQPKTLLSCVHAVLGA